MFEINDRVQRTIGRVEDRSRLGTIVETDGQVGRCRVLWDEAPRSKAKRTWFSRKFLTKVN